MLYSDSRVRPDDTTLSIAVKLAFLRSCRSRANAIEVETRNAIVHLSGFVLSERDLVRAYKAARTVPGVLWIDNEVRVLHKVERVRRAPRVQPALHEQRAW